MSIKLEHGLNPVTALAFYTASFGEVILAGEGCYLKVYESETSILRCQCKVFEGQAIHGITLCQHACYDDCPKDIEVVIWGGHSLAIFTYKDIEAVLATYKSDASIKILPDLLHRSECLREACSTTHQVSAATCTASDWILDVVISYSKHECFLVTAHNVVLRAKVGERLGEVSLDSLHCPSRSILYSAQLIWESVNNVLVAAGTVFGEIIVWSCSIAANTAESRILHKFTGHEGSVFGVNLGPIVNDQDGNSIRLLASCSDDRTIRIWCWSLEDRENGKLLETVSASETGLSGDEKQKDVSNKCLAMVMGHSSRIWSVQFFVKGFNITVLSFGEDATTQLWALEIPGYVLLSAKSKPVPRPSRSKNATLTHLNTFAYNSGKHIWSKAVNSSKNGLAMVATGGADGKISFYEILKRAPVESYSIEPMQNKDIVTQQSSIRSQAWHLENILKDLPSTAQNPLHSCGMPSVSLEPSVQQADSFTTTTNCSSSVEERNWSPSPQRQSLIHDKSAKKLKSKNVPDAFNRYAFVSENEFLMTTTFGRIILGKIEECVTWKEVSMLESTLSLKSYSVVQGIPAIEIAFLGGANGRIFVYQQGSVEEIGQVSGKVADMFTIHNMVKVELLVATLGGKFATMFTQQIKDGSNGLSQPHESQYCVPDRFIITSAGRSNDGFLVLGSRTGALAVYDSERCDEPLLTWSSRPRSDAITSIVNLQSSIDDPKYILTSSRNGSYSIFSLTPSQIRLVHQGTPPFGPMIEAAWFSGTDLILYGFKSKNFVVWNETKQYEISSVECGGAHRSYAYSPIANCDGAGYFIYTKASKLYLHSQSKASHQIIKAGGHGREIKACSISRDGLIATGAEDTAIRIWRYQNGNSENKLECVAVVQMHTTGIQCVQWYGSDYLFSSGGNEEFFIWAVQSIEGFGIGVVCEASCPDQSEEKDLRITSFDVSPLQNSEIGSVYFLISLAYSDSTIRCYIYSKEQGFDLVAAGRYTSSCLMQLRHLEIREKELSFLTAATDGNLTVWNTAILNHPTRDSHSEVSLTSRGGGSARDDSNADENSKSGRSQGDSTPSIIAIVSNHKPHQSSIKSLDITAKGNPIMIATGGDDNALGVTIYKNLRTPPTSVILSSAHAAAITGICFVSRQSREDGEEELSIVTSGNDQRVKEWGVTVRAETERSAPNHSDTTKGSKYTMMIRKIGDAFTSVADVGDVTALIEGEKNELRKVLVVGNGMEVYEVSA